MLIEKLEVGPLMENCYIVADKEAAEGVVIDAGDEPERIAERVAELHLTIRRLVCTHGHIDHVGAVEPLKRTFGAEFCLHQKDEFYLKHTSEHGLEFGMAGLENPIVDIYIKEGDRISFGQYHLEIIETPGHSPGGISLLFEGFVIVGSVGRVDLPGGDYQAMMRSLETKLLALPDKTRLHPGHGESTTLAIERQYNPFLQGLVSPSRRI